MPDHLDGNVLAGPLSELFAFDVTSATGVCASCGGEASVAQAMVYASAMGHVARCRSCFEVLLVVVETPAGQVVNFRGLASLRVGR